MTLIPGERSSPCSYRRRDGRVAKLMQKGPASLSIVGPKACMSDETVQKAPRHEVAGSWAPARQRALWRLYAAVLRKMGLLLMPLSYVIEGSDWSWSTRRGMRSESPTPWDRCRIHKKWWGGWRRGSAIALRILQGVPQLEHPATPAPPRP